MAKKIPDVIERRDSASGVVSSNDDGSSGREVRLQFLIKGMPNYHTAEEKALEIAPYYYNYHRRSRVEITHVGSGFYEVTASYANTSFGLIDQSDKPDTFVTDDGTVLLFGGLTIDTTGGTEHVVQCPLWSTERSFPDGEAPFMEGAVNVVGDKVNGVDITMPSFAFTETYSVSADRLLTRGRDGKTWTPWMETLHKHTGKVNSKKFRVFDAGEVLFMGARTQVTPGQTNAQVTLSFSVRRNIVGTADEPYFVGQQIEIDRKDGWDFLWIEYEDVAEGDALLKRPKYVYIDPVYERVDFRVLGITDTRKPEDTEWPAENWIDSNDADPRDYAEFLHNSTGTPSAPVTLDPDKVGVY